MSTVALTGLAVVLAAGPLAAQTVTNTWTAAVSGVWSNGANWQGGTAPPAGGSTTTVLQFNNSGATTGITATNDLTGTFSLNGLLFNSSDTGGFLVAGSALSFGGTAPVLNQNNNGPAAISQAITAASQLTVGGSGSGRLVLTGAITNTAGLQVNDAGFDVASTAVISGAGAVAKSGNGALTLSGANTYSGGTTLNGGTLNINNAGNTTTSALGTGLLTINGGTLGNTSGGAVNFSLTTPITQTWAGDFAYASNNNLNLGTGAVTMTGSRQITVPGPGVLTVAGAISGSGFGIAKLGAGTLTLSGANTFTGGVTLSGGTLRINAAGALGSGALTINDGTTIDNNSGAAVTVSTNNAQTWNGSFSFAGNNNLTFGSGTITLAASPTITTNGSTLTVPGTITGSGSITKAGPNTLALSAAITTGAGNVTLNAGTLTLSGANTFTGGVIVNAGTLNVNSATALGTGTLTVNGGSLNNSSGSPITLTNSNPQLWNGDFTYTGGNVLNFGTGVATINANRTVTVNGTGTTGVLTVGGVSGGFGLTKLGTGTLSITGASTYSGTTVGGGTLAGTAQASGSPFGSGPISVGTAVLSLVGNAAGATTTTVGDFTTAGGATLTVNNTGTAGTALAAGNLVRSATNTLVVTPVAGQLAGGENVTFANGATLAGSTNAGILPPWVVAQTNGTTPSADFVTYGINGLTTAGVYTSTNVDDPANNSNVVVSSTGATLTGDRFAYAVKTTGAITIPAANTLTLGNASGQGGLILNTGGGVSGGTLSFNGQEGVVYVQSTATIGSTITNGSMTVFGPGALTVTGTNTYTGGTTLVSGTTILGNNAALGTGTITFAGGAMQAVSGTDLTGVANPLAITANSTISGTNSITFTGTLTARANATLTNAVSTAGKSVTLGPINLSDGTAGHVLTIVNSGAASATLLAGNITEIAGQPGSLAITGTTAGNSFTIGGSNNYSGGTTITVNTGTGANVTLNSDSPFGSGLVTNVVSGSSPQVTTTNGPHTIPNDWRLLGGMNPTGSSATNSLALTGNFTVVNATGGSRTINNLMTGGSFAMGSAGKTIILGDVDGLGKTLIVTSTGSSTTVGNGSTTILGGALNDPPNVQPGAGGSLTLNGGTGTNFSAVQLNAAGTYSGGTSITANNTWIQIGANSDSPFTKGPFGTGPVEFNNATNNQRVQPFGADRTVANAITMTSGFIVENAPTTGTGPFVDPTGLHSLTLTGPITLPTVNRTITNNLTSPTFLTLGSNTAPSTITLGGTPFGVSLILAGSGSVVVNDVLQDPPNAVVPGGLTIGNSNTTNTKVTLNAVNTYNGATSITAGAGTVVTIGSDQPFGYPAATAIVTVGNATTAPVIQASGPHTIPNNVVQNNPVTFSGSNSITITGGYTNNGSQTLTSGITGTGNALTLANVYLSASATTGGTFTISTNAGSTTNVTGVIANFNTGVGLTGGTAGNLVAAGGGTLNLTGANTYTGTTTVNTGATLRVNNTAGSGTGAGAVTVNSGGTLGGSGFIVPNTGTPANNTVTIAGTVAPGNSIGTLTFGSGTTPVAVALNGTYTAEADPASSNSDLISVQNSGSTLTLGPASTLTVVSLSPGTTPTGTYTLAIYPSGSPVTPFGTVNLPPEFTSAGYGVLYNQPAGAGVLGIQVAPVPEPAFVLAACGGLAALAGWHRRRKAGGCPTPAGR